jgi:hypothetical protein
MDQMTSRHILPWSVAQSMCNKLTCLYWCCGAQEVYGSGESVCSNGPCAVVWKEWHRHDNLSRLDLGFYFAKCFKLRKSAVTSIPELLSLHRTMCTLHRGKVKLQKEVPDPQTCEISTEVENAKMLPLCRAIIIVLDQRVPEHEVERIKDATGNLIAHPKSPEAFAPLQNVLLVRTRDEADLSASINFSQRENTPYLTQY